MRKILHNQPTIDGEEIEAVARVIRTNWIIAGAEVEDFERHMRQLINSAYAVAVNSGTSALHVSLLALGIEADDEVILPSYTSADILNAIFYVRAIPVLCDSEKDGCNIDLEQIKKKLTKKTKVMIIPHTFGIPAQIDKIKQYQIPIIEDCAQALGTTYQGKMVGSFGDISIFSFYATKIITTGQGGIVLTNNKKYYDYIRDIINYNGRKNYKIRYNYPMTDIAASIGNIQIKQLDQFVHRRQIIAARYAKILDKKHVFYFPKKNQQDVNPFRFVLQLSDNAQVKKIKKFFLNKNIVTKIPIKRYELLHNLLDKNPRDFPYAEYLAKVLLSVPIYPGLQEEDIERILSVLQRI